MKAVVFKDVGKIALANVPDPQIENPKDAIIKITMSAICGTDLHLVRGTMANVKSGLVLGHEAVGIVEQIGKGVKDFNVGDRVIIPSTICCDSCDYCSKELFVLCDKANPNGPDKGAAFYGGPKDAGSFNGLQAEKVRVPFADANLIRIYNDVSDEQAILLSDILPTSYMAVEMADVHPKDTVAVFGCGPVGQMAIGCLKQLHVKNIIAIDCVPSRLKMAKEQGAQIINFNEEDPVKALKKLTHNKGPEKIIDAVGIDAHQPQSSLLGFFKNWSQKKQFKQELKEVAPRTNPNGGNWVPGDAPSQVLQWAVESIAKGGTFSIIGVYTELLRSFPIGAAMGKNLTIRIADCNHRKYIPMLLKWVHNGQFNPLQYITHKLAFEDVIEGYKHFDKRADGWIKVILKV